MENGNKSFLIYVSTFTLIVGAVVVGNYIFYKYIFQKKGIPDNPENKSNV